MNKTKLIILLIWIAVLLFGIFATKTHGYNRSDLALELHQASTHCENIEYGYAHSNMHYILQECEYTTEYSTTTVRKAILLDLDQLKWRRIIGWKF